MQYDNLLLETRTVTTTTRMSLISSHTSAKAADVAKLLLLYTLGNKYIVHAEYFAGSLSAQLTVTLRRP